MAAGLSAAGKESKHDCNTHEPPKNSKQSKKAAEEERAKQQLKEE